MKPLLDFDDAGAADDEPVKAVTVGDIRAWHDQYDQILTSWAECRDLLSKEKSKVFYLVEVLQEIRTYSTDPTAVNGAADALDGLLTFLDRLKVSPVPSQTRNMGE